MCAVVGCSEIISVELILQATDTNTQLELVTARKLYISCFILINPKSAKPKNQNA